MSKTSTAQWQWYFRGSDYKNLYIMQKELVQNNYDPLRASALDESKICAIKYTEPSVENEMPKVTLFTKGC